MQPSTSIKTRVFSIIGTLALGISLCAHAATIPNRYVTNLDGTALEIVVGVNTVDLGTNDTRSTLGTDFQRITNFPVVVLKPVITNLSMVLDLMPSGDNTVTNLNSPFFTAIDLLNRNLTIVADKTNFYVGRFALKTNDLIIGSSAGGTNDAPRVTFQAGTNNARPFSWVYQSTGGAGIVTNAWMNTNGTLWLLGGIQGTTNNDNAVLGTVGEYMNVLVPFGNATNLVNGGLTNLMQLTLTPGDWDVEAIATFEWTSATVTKQRAGISTTFATLPVDGSASFSGVQLTTTTTTDSLVCTRKRMILNATTIVYLVVQNSFSAGSCVGYGNLTARRVR